PPTMLRVWWERVYLARCLFDLWRLRLDVYTHKSAGKPPPTMLRLWWQRVYLARYLFDLWRLRLTQIGG
ncbi:hypothetical protein, partial [Pseudoalteromonas piscicida]